MTGEAQVWRFPRSEVSPEAVGMLRAGKRDDSLNMSPSSPHHGPSGLGDGNVHRQFTESARTAKANS